MKRLSKKLALITALLAFSGAEVQAQYSSLLNTISTRPFQDGVNHWYHIKDATNIVNPIENQPQYAETDYTKIADNIVLFQRDNGGWPKNYDMKAILTPEQIKKVKETKGDLHTTFDNSTTYTHIYYLAQVYSLTKKNAYKKACLKGIDFILKAQYENGGWPQYFPLEKNYSRHITFNDGAYMGIMNLLKNILNSYDPLFAFIDDETRANVATAYNKGIDCILNMQIMDQGKLTAWCQQHDEITLLPAWARAFEPPSICNGESSDIVMFLMDIENPDEKIIKSVESAVQWFAASRIYNTRVETFDAPKEESKYMTITKDNRVVTDSTAQPIWTRYYELGTGRPLFSDRNHELLYSMAEVSRERRAGYAWYTYAPKKVLDRYAKWQKKWAPSTAVIKP